MSKASSKKSAKAARAAKSKRSTATAKKSSPRAKAKKAAPKKGRAAAKAKKGTKKAAPARAKKARATAKAAPKKAPAKKTAVQKPKARRKTQPATRRDGAGHIDPAHAARLRELSESSHDESEDRGFVNHHRSREPLAEELGEGSVSNMTSGEDGYPEALDEKVDEENGGPFVETSAQEEFARGTDESNIDEATREPFPRTTGGSD